MLFTSPVFMYVFLPAVLLLYWLTPRPLKNALLALASLFFYFWGEVAYAWVFLISVVFNYGMGRAIGSTRGRPAQVAILAFACVANLSMLAYFKYADFIVGNINVLLDWLNITAIQPLHVHLPIGISFVTFHALSYLIDIKRGTSREQKDPLDVLLYLSLFPQLIAGPIIRYNQIADQIKSRTMSIDGVYAGLRRFAFGLAKKMLIANQLGVVADHIFAIQGSDLTTPLAWLGITAYSLQLYFDFSGYSCMAIGLAMMFGFHFPENFNYPYISRSIQEFWRRWHISLSSWFRDYLYIPLGGNRKGGWRTYFNLVLVFFLCGLWHGASWNFVVWGLFHGGFLVIERAGLASWLDRTWRPVSHIYTILVFMVAWVFFRSPDLPYSLHYIAAMFGGGSATFRGDNVGFHLTPDVILTFTLGIIFSCPLWRITDERLQRAIADKKLISPLLQIADGAMVLTLLFVCALYINEGSYNPFIYFRF
jgi:alginate O-acetyltransferase complex protein AlgI